MRLQLDSQVVQTGGTDSLSASGAAAGREKASVAQDSVRVSTLSSALGRLAADHSARLQQIAAAVADGSYRVSGSAIASAITNHALASR